MIDEKIMIALISGIISLLVSLVSIFVLNRKFKHDLALKEKEMLNNHQEKLYNMRLDSYQQAFCITEELGKKRGKSDLEIKEHIQKILSEITSWKKGIPNLILSDKALTSYYKLYDNLKVNSAFSDKYSDKQIENIWNARNQFRKELRNDIRV